MDNQTPTVVSWQAPLLAPGTHPLTLKVAFLGQEPSLVERQRSNVPDDRLHGQACTTIDCSECCSLAVKLLELLDVTPSTVVSCPATLGVAAALKASRPYAKVIGSAMTSTRKTENVDQWFEVTDAEAMTMTNKVHETYLVQLDMTSSGALVTAITFGQSLTPGETCLVLLPERADKTLLHTASPTTEPIAASQGGINGVVEEDAWRGAAVEDLQLPPALTVLPTDLCGRVLCELEDNDYDNAPVINGRKRLEGLVGRHELRRLLKEGLVQPTDPIAMAMHRFSSKETGEPYWPITPETPLAELHDFFKHPGPHRDIAFITDANNWCLGVVTKNDLESFLTSRRPCL